MNKTRRIEVLTRPTLSLMGEVKHEVLTTKSLRFWEVKITVNGRANQAQRVHHQSDLPVATKTMLKTEHLLGNYSAFTRAALVGGTGKRAGVGSRIR